MLPSVRLKSEIVSPNPREKIRETLSALWMRVETKNPFNPSDSIMPTIKKKPRTAEKAQPETKEAEIEKMAI